MLKRLALWRQRSRCAAARRYRRRASEGQGHAAAQLVPVQRARAVLSSARSAATSTQEGIDLDIQEGRGSGVTVQAVAAGTATFGYADVPTMIKAAAKGAPVTAIGVALQMSPMSVMGFSDKNIRTPKDIKGKTVAVTPGDSMSQIWPLFLKKTEPEGRRLQDRRRRRADQAQRGNERPGRPAARLRDGPGDQAAGRDQKAVYPIRFADYGVNMVSSGVIAQKDFLKQKPDLAKRFMRAATRSLEEAAKNPEAAVDAMIKAQPKSGVKDTALVGMKQTARALQGPRQSERPPLPRRREEHGRVA